MDTSIIVALITTAGAFAGTFYGVRKNNNVMEYRIDELTREVRKHNNFAVRVPVIEKEIENGLERIKDLEKKVEK